MRRLGRDEDGLQRDGARDCAVVQLRGHFLARLAQLAEELFEVLDLARVRVLVAGAQGVEALFGRGYLLVNERQVEVRVGGRAGHPQEGRARRRVGRAHELVVGVVGGRLPLVLHLEDDGVPPFGARHEVALVGLARAGGLADLTGADGRRVVDAEDAHGRRAAGDVVAGVESIGDFCAGDDLGGGRVNQNTRVAAGLGQRVELRLDSLGA